MINALKKFKGTATPTEKAAEKIVPVVAGNTDFTFKETMMVVNPTLLEQRVGSETLIVGGSSRGMTSVVSHSLYELGYFLGNRLQENNYEDIEFQEAFPDINLTPGRLVDRESLKDLVARRNGDHVRWGFKLPRVSDYVDEFTDVFRDPVFVLCIRNPVATGRSIMKRNPGIRAGAERIMDHAQKSLRAIDKVTAMRDMPTLIVNMDEAQRRPRKFLIELSSLLGISGDVAGIAANVKKRSYKLSDPREGVSFHGPQEQGKVAER